MRRVTDRSWRLASGTAGLALIAIYLVIGIGALGGLVLVFNPRSPPVPFLTGASPLYRLVMTSISVALAATALRYGYYYFCWLSTGHDFHRQLAPPDAVALVQGDLPYVKFQVTTKGGALPVVERSLAGLEAAVAHHPRLALRLSAEVITEAPAEVECLNARFRTSPLRVTALTLPPDYQTPKGTLMKARALHYMVERRREGFEARPGRTFIVHLDEETLVPEEQLLVLLAYLAGAPRAISEGPIFYPLEWENTPWLCRSMESMRPFGCSECARVMRKPPPPHLHGSNLVIDEAVENDIGWDLGTLDGQPYIAEDLLFGLKASARLGEGAFGWHGATMLEQPPLSVAWGFRQRQRWVLGGLQGLQAMWRDPGFAHMPGRQKLRLHLAIAFRIATYALGFPMGLAGLTFLVNNLILGGGSAWRGAASSPWGIVLTAGALAWLLSYQIGLSRNLRYLPLSRWQRVRQGTVILLLTPIAGLVETIGPFTAVTSWLLGLRQARWTPTAKLPQAPAGAG